MGYFKWIRAVVIAASVFFAVSQSAASDTSSFTQATQYATSTSNFSIQNFTVVDRYLGGSFKVNIFDDIKHAFKHAFDAIKHAAEEAVAAVKSAVETAMSAVKSAITVAAEDTGDALKKAGEVTGDFIKAHGALIGMLAGAVLLTVVTDGMMGPAVGELVADDIAVAATEAGVEAGTDAAEVTSEAATEATSEAAQAGGNAASKASEAAGESAAEGGADSATTIDEDVAAALKNGSTKLEKLADKGQRVSSWYSREVEAATIVEAIKDKNFKKALLGIAELQTKLSGNAATNPVSVYSNINEVEEILQGFNSNNAAPNSAASQTQLANALQQAQALQQQIAAQVTAAAAQLPASSDPANISAAYGVIAAAAQSTTNPSGLTSTQQTTVQEWATQHNTASDVVFLAAALKFSNLYNAAQGGTATQQAAYQNYVNSLPASGLGAIMGFAANGKLISSTTALSNQSLLLTSPYEYYLSTQIQAEQNNLTAQQDQKNLATSVTATNSSDYAIAQMATALNSLTSAQRASVMSTFYGNALAAGDTTVASLMQQYITPGGVIINSNIPTTQTETVQTVINNAQANIATASNSLTTVQNLQNGYDYSAYANNLSASTSDLTQVAVNIPQATPSVTAASVQAQIANSGLSTTTQASLTTFLTQNNTQASMVNAVSATIQFAQLFNAAYDTSNPSATAQQAFTSYINRLDPHTATTMMNFAVKNGLVSQQDSLILTDPAQYLQNEENIANQNNGTLSNLLNNLASNQGQFNGVVAVFGSSSQNTPFQNIDELNIAQAQEKLAKLNWQFVVNPQQYAMSQLYNATKGWSQAQLKTLGSRVYYGSIVSGNGMALTVQNYLTPSGAYQNNPQGIMAAQQQAAMNESAMGIPQITPAAAAQALQKMSPQAAQSWVNSYQMAQQQNQQMASSGGPSGPGGIYNNAISQYQARPQTPSISSASSAQQVRERIEAQLRQQMMSANDSENAQAEDGLGMANYS